MHPALPVIFFTTLSGAGYGMLVWIGVMLVVHHPGALRGQGPAPLFWAVPLVIAFGLTPWILMIYELLDVGVTLFSHSNIRLPAWLDAGLRRVIVTPDLHRVHHSTWQPETDSNFGAVFPIWDMVFGTYRTRTRDAPETMRLGLADDRGREVNELVWLLRSAFR